MYCEAALLADGNVPVIVEAVEGRFATSDAFVEGMEVSAALFTFTLTRPERELSATPVCPAVSIVPTRRHYL